MIDVFSRLGSLFPLSPTPFRSAYSNPLLAVLILIKVRQFCSSSSANPINTTEVFRKFGCSDAEISKIFLRQPLMLKAKHTILSPKLTLLSTLGLTSSDLVKMIHSRPRFLNHRIIGSDTHERIDYLYYLFGTKEMLLKAIIRDPSLLSHGLDQMKNCVSQYERLGISKEELVPMLISRPTILTRTSLTDEKLDYIKRFNLSNTSKMYKYVVSLIAISHLDTILEKMTNLEKFGLSGDQVMTLFRQSPLLLTLSVDKVQRNMTFVIGRMKLPPNVILQYPFLLLSNLESVLKPRYLLGEKMESMSLHPQIKGPNLLRALRMKEPRFLKAFINCHSEDVTNDLMEQYTQIKGMKRLAETARRGHRKGFSF